MDSPMILTRLGMALLCGSLIGFERQWHQKMAGLRTNALVALGAAGFVAFSALFPGGDSPTRMAAQIISGIGFLGAGVIMRDGLNVHGLNTAATLWCSAMVGTFAGGGLLQASVIATGFIIGTNLVLRPVVEIINRRAFVAGEVPMHYQVEITCRAAEEAHIRSLLLQALISAGLGLHRMESADLADSGKVTVSALALAQKRSDSALEQIAGQLSLEPYVTAVRWQVDQAMAEG